jgi:hypothetical protein
LAERRGTVSHDDSVPFIELLERRQPELFEPSRGYGLILRPNPGRAEIGKRASVDGITQRANAASDV